jgi:hypothetical protein
MPSMRGFWSWSPAGRLGMPRHAQYFLIGFVPLIVAAGLIGWHFFGGRGKVLKPDGEPVVTVMDFGQSFPLDPLPSGWQHRKFWTRSPMRMAFAVKDGVPSMRSETDDSVDALSACRYRPCRLPDARVAVVHRIAHPQPARRAHARRRRSPGAAVSSVRDGSRREARDGGYLGQSAETGGVQIHRRFPTLHCRRRRRADPDVGSTSGSTSLASMVRSGRMPYSRA